MSADLAAALEARVAELVKRQVGEELRALGYTPGDHDPLVAIEEYLEVSRSQANRLARSIPSAVRFGKGGPRARRSDLDAFIAARSSARRRARPGEGPADPRSTLVDLGFGLGANDSNAPKASNTR